MASTASTPTPATAVPRIRKPDADAGSASAGGPSITLLNAPSICGPPSRAGAPVRLSAPRQREPRSWVSPPSAWPAARSLSRLIGRQTATVAYRFTGGRTGTRSAVLGFESSRREVGPFCSAAPSGVRPLGAVLGQSVERRARGSAQASAAHDRQRSQVLPRPCVASHLRAKPSASAGSSASSFRSSATRFAST